MKYIIGSGIALVVLAAVLGFAPNFRESIGAYRPLTTERAIVSATATTVSGTPVSVKDFNLVGFTVSALTASGTVKFPCSMAESAFSLTSAASASNRYSYAEVVDLENGNTIDGNVGLSLSPVTTTVRHFAIKDNGYTYCSALYLQGTANTGSTTIHILQSSN